MTWDGVDRANSWTVAFGSESGKYIYGAHNFGDANSRGIRINSLPGYKYYFVLRANNGCMPGAFSAEKAITLREINTSTLSISDVAPTVTSFEKPKVEATSNEQTSCDSCNAYTN